MSLDEQRTQVVRYWWTKAQESLASARREVEAGAFAFAMNRVYYAAFYAVSAALFERRLSFKKHSGVRATFHRELIKTGLLDVAWGRFYDRLFEDRQEGDYIALVDFDREYVENQLDRCRAFHDQTQAADFLCRVGRTITSAPAKEDTPSARCQPCSVR